MLHSVRGARRLAMMSCLIVISGLAAILAAPKAFALSSPVTYSNFKSTGASLVIYRSFESKYVSARDVTVLLPEGYDGNATRYPVIYMQDGQALYDASQSLSHVSWGVATTVSRLIREHRIPPVIIVGIANTSARGREYLPQRICQLLPERTQQLIRTGWGGAPQSDQYLRFVVDELKPFIDDHYHTQSGPAGTYVMGSSMGALIAFYAQMEYPAVFGGSASLSMHWLLGNPAAPLPQASVLSRQVLRAFETYVLLTDVPPQAHRVYIDRGTVTLDARYVPYTQSFAKFMQSDGWQADKTFENRVYPGAGHSEKAWRARLSIPLEFLLTPLLDPRAAARTEERENAERLAQVRGGMSPTDYLISKFETADVVLLGEDHARAESCLCREFDSQALRCRRYEYSDGELSSSRQGALVKLRQTHV